MAQFPTFPKDPAEKLDFTFDWSDWLGVETIASRVTTVPTGLTRWQSDSQLSTKTTVNLAGGTAGQDYKVTDEITTAPSGLVAKRTIVIQVRER